jgi:hypothetical protein
MTLPAAFLTPDGRRALAFLAILGGCVTMTIFAAVGVWLSSGNATYSFWLAMAAHAQIAIGLTGFGALLWKRTIKAGRDGLEISDGDAVVLEKV